MGPAVTDSSATPTRLASLTTHMQGLLQDALAPSTQAAYKRTWEMLTNFCTQLGVDCSLPTRVATLALFITDLDQKGYAPATISSHVSAIGYVHKLNGWSDPTPSFLVQKLLGACHKKNRQTDVRLPIEKPILGKLIHATNYTIERKDHRSLFKAMFSLAFHAFLRVGEMTASAGHVSKNTIHLEQLAVQPSNMKLTFKSYKHSKGQPFTLTIQAAPLAPDCPVRIMQEYLAGRGSSSGPLFQFRPNCPVTRANFNTQLRHALQFCQLPTDRYKSHSFRIGAATEASRQGLSDSQIRQLGRWQSDAFTSYIRVSQRLSSL